MLQIERLLHAIPHPLEDCQRSAGDLAAARDRRQIGIRCRFVDEVLDDRLRVGDGALPRLRIGPDQLVRIFSSGDSDDANLAHGGVRPELLEQAALRGGLAREVNVVREGHRVRVSRRQLHLPTRQRGAERGDHVSEPRLVGGHHVRIALDDDGQLRLSDRCLGEIDREKRPTLVEERRGRGVEVLRPLQARKNSPAQSGGLPGLVPDREDDPTAELVDYSSSIGWPGESGADELLVAEAACPEAFGERVPHVWRVTDREAIQDLIAEPTFGQIPARSFPLRRAQQHFAIPGDRCLERLAQSPALPILPRRLGRQLDAGLLRQAGERLAEVHAVTLHQEGEDVAALAASEAMPALAIRRHDERGCLLRVERAQALVGGAGALERNRLANDVYDGQPRFDVGDDPRGSHSDGRSCERLAVVKGFVKRGN